MLEEFNSSPQCKQLADPVLPWELYEVAVVFAITLEIRWTVIINTSNYYANLITNEYGITVHSPMSCVRFFDITTEMVKLWMGER